MKVKLLISATLIIASNQLATSQIAEVNWGDPTKLNKNSVNTGIFAEDDGYIYSTRTHPTDYSSSSIYVDKVSKADLATESSFEIYNSTMYSSGDNTPRHFQFNEVIMTEDGYIAFFTEPNYELYTFTSYCQKFDFNGNKIGEAKSLQIFQGHEKTVIGKFVVIRSPLNDGFFLMYSRPFILYDNEYLIFDFYDYNLEKKWERKQKFPFNGKEFEPRQYKTNVLDSTLYLVVRVLDETEEERLKKNNKTVNYSFALLDFKFDPNDTSSTFNATPLEVGRKYISDISFDILNHELIFAGFFADRKDMEASGAFCIVMEEYSKAVRTTELQDFPKKFDEKFADPDKYAIMRGGGIRDFELQDLQIMNDGSIYLIAENKWAASTVEKVNGYVELVHMPYYNNIVVTKINNERKIDWITAVMKRQKETKFHTNENAGLSLSYTYAIYKEKVVIIYNDLAKNLKVENPAELKYVTKPGGTVTVVASINDKGEVSREVLFDAENAKTVICPKASVVDGKDQIYIYTIIGNTQRWALFKFY